ncbi:hypothetical protein BU25DRAFT_405998 [Macroventuria anomochaeta]|uniref:Uncharacterized protein n=1 Tax=Macroventuria anomochaeta TaxID=301207 RepID=A0ACB6SEC5_9PLEO|nr:uncharacterized protein BU25DRAFT_405998 [Macroventuria anomochaeta]KAF2632676.1 hypothetical protein BU25DRAFT_405998 [Macroventuria anomochaeta]
MFDTCNFGKEDVEGGFVPLLAIFTAGLCSFWLGLRPQTAVVERVRPTFGEL